MRIASLAPARAVPQALRPVPRPAAAPPDRVTLLGSPQDPGLIPPPWKRPLVTERTRSLDDQTNLFGDLDVDGNTSLPGDDYRVYTPQHLADRLDRDGTVRSTETVREEVLPNGQKRVSTRTRHFVLGADGGVERELSRIQSGDARPMWHYRERQGDVYNEQTFIQGSSDYTAVRHRDYLGWQRKTQEARFADAHRAAEKAGLSKEGLPPRSFTLDEMSREKAGAEDVRQAMRALHLGSATEDPQVERFLRELGSGQVEASLEYVSPGSHAESRRRMVLRGEDGRTLVLDQHGDERVVSVKQGDEIQLSLTNLLREEPSRQLRMQLDRGTGELNVATLGNAGWVPERTLSRDATLARDLADLGVKALDARSAQLATSLGRLGLNLGADGLQQPWAQHSARRLETALDLERGTLRTGDAAEVLRRGSVALDRLEGRLEGARLFGGFTGALGGVAAYHDVLSISAALERGDRGQALAALGKLTGDSGAAVEGLARALGAQQGHRLGRVLKVGGALGLAGGGADVIAGLGKLADGDLAGGGLDTLGGSGGLLTGLNAFGRGAAWFGPVGWGLSLGAAAASALLGVQEHNQEVRIASPRY